MDTSDDEVWLRGRDLEALRVGSGSIPMHQARSGQPARTLSWFIACNVLPSVDRAEGELARACEARRIAAYDTGGRGM
jgi:hypothetical protein